MPSTPPVRHPLVAARSKSRTALVPLAAGLLCVGTAVFAKMVDARNDRAVSAFALPPLAFNSLAAPAKLTEPKPVIATPFVPHGAPVLLTAAPAPLRYPPRAVPFLASGLAPPNPSAGRFGGSALILDLFTRGGTRNEAARMGQEQPLPPVGPGRSETAPDPTGDAIAAANAIPPQASSGTSNDRFAQRVGTKQTDVSQAQQLQNLNRLVPQGSIVGAVMETALNSDLPGYARAVVTNDVLSFDGSVVLIPAGSRVVGEYNSGVAQGASRIFIVWNRLIRPDGVAITLGSPAIDELGRGGLGGKVNRHFLQRFGGAILLSVLTGGINGLAGSLGGGSTIVVNSSSEATSLLTQASRGTDIAPTIKTNQGALVRIFVARDLDFSAVGPSRL